MQFLLKKSNINNRFLTTKSLIKILILTCSSADILFNNLTHWSYWCHRIRYIHSHSYFTIFLIGMLNSRHSQIRNLQLLLYARKIALLVLFVMHLNMYIKSVIPFEMSLGTTKRLCRNLVKSYSKVIKVMQFSNLWVNKIK